MNEHIRIFTDSAIVVQRIVELLEEHKIPSLTKDNVESARLAGFGSSYENVELYVYTSDFERAEQLIQSYMDVE